METVNWIHISDLHYGCKEGVPTKEFRADAIPYLVEYYKEINQKPKYIFVTGDIVYPKNNNNISGSYKNALEFIESMAKELEIDKKNIFVVPGNHDVSCQENDERYVAAKKVRESGNYNYKFGQVQASCIEQWKKLKPTKEYQFFYEQLYGRPYEPNHEMISRQNDNIDILCIDTSMVSIGSKYDSGKLLIGTNELWDLVGTSKRERPLMILGHHPISFLLSSEQNYLEKLLVRQDVIAYLYGHTHYLGFEVPYTYRFRNNQNAKSFDAVCCPTHMGEEDIGRLSTMIGLVTGTYDIESQTGEVVFHIWSEENGGERFSYPIGRKSESVISIVEKTNKTIKEKFEKYGKSNSEETNSLLSDYILFIFKDCMKEINYMLRTELFAIREDIYNQTRVEEKQNDIRGKNDVLEMNVGEKKDYDDKVNVKQLTKSNENWRTELDE